MKIQLAEKESQTDLVPTLVPKVPKLRNFGTQTEETMAKRQKLSFCQLDELPDEVILKIVGFLDLKELLLCGQVSKRL